MTLLEFLSAFIGQVLSWPVVALLVIVMFRGPISDLIGRVRSYEGFGQKATFAAALAEVSTAAEAVVGEARRSAPVEPESDTETLEAVEPAPAAVEADPTSTVIVAWEEVVKALGAAARSAGLLRPGAAVSVSRLLADLERAGVLTPTFFSTARDLRALRNQVAHGVHQPTSAEAEAFAVAAGDLREAAGVVARGAT